MRTTLTIDDDVAARLAEIRAEDGERFKPLLNRVLRAGLDTLRKNARRPPSRPFSTRTFPSKCLLPADKTSTHDMFAFAEGEDWQ